MRDVGRRSIDDEEEPEELVAALHNDMPPYAAADQGLTAPMWLLQQQLRRWILSCQGCIPHTIGKPMSSQLPRLYTTHHWSSNSRGSWLTRYGLLCLDGLWLIRGSM